ncbi:CgeB family protein [Luteimonas suaedae]|uniref:CgeB family protein n=1 Tax=Luteimonas suaedae TaxID=2605430 RepID=UPI0011ECFADA|nr:glycosyltransferase [Luteimonas suaedae]
MTIPLDIVFLGLSLRSSWGNGHATTYRALIEALEAEGHRVLFLERDVPWYAQHQDAAGELPGTLALYDGLESLQDAHRAAVEQADLVVVGSYVPDGIAVGEWAQRTARGVVAFYDIDTPVTVARLEQGGCDYLHPRLIPGYDLYLSFSGGPLLRTLTGRYGAPLALPFYCSADVRRYYHEPLKRVYDLGYMGTYSDDRQPVLQRLLLDPAHDWPGGRFAVAGPQYPESIAWPENVERIEHLGPAEHRAFYNRQRFTLNVTRADMVAAGWSPSVRLFEAAACATPIVSDRWPGIETLFEPGREILLADTPAQVLACLREMPHEERVAMGRRARSRVLSEHTAAHRAYALARYFDRAVQNRTDRCRTERTRPGQEPPVRQPEEVS